MAAVSVAVGAGLPQVPPPLYDMARHPQGGVCTPLPPAGGRVVRVARADQLVRAVAEAGRGTTILVADGTYRLDGAFLRFATPGVTLRGASGRREAVVLDGGYASAEIVQILASDVTVADLTLTRAYDHPIHVMPAGGRDTTRTLLYNVRVVDPGQQAIKVNPVEGGGYTDQGIVACSRVELTDEGRGQVRDHCYTGGIDVHASRDWVIRDNHIEGFWCARGLSEHAIHFWRASRDTVVERNVLRNNARGVGFGMATDGPPRAYTDDVCPAARGFVDHLGGIVRNNAVAADRPDLFASEAGLDCGICLWNACGVRVGHNTVFTTNPARTFSAIEWRFPNTTAEIVNNLVNHRLRERDAARASTSGNIEHATAQWFVDASSGNLHLGPLGLPAAGRAAAPAWVPDDIDGQARPRDGRAHAGADEAVDHSPAAASDRRPAGAGRLGPVFR